MNPELDDRDLRRHHARDQHAPLGGCAVLPAHRQAARPPRHRDRRRVQARAASCSSRAARPPAQGQNALVIRVQPDEGVTIRFGSKVPGAGTQVRDVTMDFGYGHAFTEASPEAYERLILDVLLGDPPLFPRHEEVELSWKILDPIEEFWASQGGPLEQYSPGLLGPGIRGRDARPRRPDLEAPVIVDLPDTTVSKISRALVSVREEGGAVALGRVLTLIIADAPRRRGRGHRGRQRRLARAPDARHRPHDRRRATPSRASTRRSASAATPARARSSSLRAHGEAGVEPREPRHRPAAPRRPRRRVVAGLDPRRCPSQTAARPDRAAADHGCLDPVRRRRTGSPRSASNHAPGDTDLAWTRLTRWREQLAAVLDQPPYEPVTAVRRARRQQTRRRRRSSPRGCASCSTCRSTGRTSTADEWPHGIKSVRLVRESGDILLERPTPGDRVPHPARAAEPRPRLPAPHAARMPRRGAPAPRSGRPVWSSHHRGLGAPGLLPRTHATQEMRDAWLSPGPRSAW